MVPWRHALVEKLSPRTDAILFPSVYNFRSEEILQGFSAARWAAAYIHMNIKKKEIRYGIRSPKNWVGVLELGKEDFLDIL